SRSGVMSRIRGRDTAPELLVRREVWRRGLRYRVSHRIGRARADFAFPGHRVAVFIDGCFWHGCPDHYVRPRTRTLFWAAKLRENVSRDQRQTRELEREGWRVIRAWEHEAHTSLSVLVERIVNARMTEPFASPPGQRWQVAEA